MESSEKGLETITVVLFAASCIKRWTIVVVQLPAIVEANFPVECGNQSIMGHR